MPNQIPTIQRILDAKRRGWPEGTAELWRDMDAIFKRISELENALSPFAEVALRERGSTLPLVSVYLKDCQVAANALDPAQGVHTKPDDFFSIPAA